MPEQERNETIGDVRAMLEHQRNMTNAAHQTISHMSGELLFWKKLALSELGVDSQKVNELVQYGGFGGGLGSVAAMQTSLRR